MMKRLNAEFIVALGAVVCAACNGDGLTPNGPPDGAAADMTVFWDVDSGQPPDADDASVEPYNLCGDYDTCCQVFGLGPEYEKPFPLPTDPRRDPAAGADGVRRDANGWLVLDQPQRNSGSYSYVVRAGCIDVGMPTEWYTIDWHADVAANTSLTMHARSGPTVTPDKTWGTWTADYKLAPVDLSQPGVLIPNWQVNPPSSDNANSLQVEFEFRSSDPAATPKLKSLLVAYKCAYCGL